MVSQQLFTEIAGSTPSPAKADNWSLVLWAANIAHVTVREDDRLVLLVHPRKARRARQEITAYEQENRNWPPRLLDSAKTAGGQPPTILMLGALLVFFVETGPWSGASHWFARGAASAERIMAHGEWFRAVTSLTLHADAMHIAGNLLIGGFLVHLFCRLVGSGFGWLLILLSGIAGNLLNAFFHGSAHNSVGFSTAVFGTVGLLSGLQAGRRQARTMKAMLLPLAAGGGLLAMLGTEGERTDLGAHLFGFVAGCLLGFLLATLGFGRRWMVPAPLQPLLLLVAVGIVLSSWQFALG